MDTNQPPILELISELQKSGVRGLRLYCTWIDRYIRDEERYVVHRNRDEFYLFANQLCEDERWELAAIAKTMNAIRYLSPSRMSPITRVGTDIPDGDLDHFARMAMEKLAHANGYVETHLSRPLF